jgi:hypothetical protein
MIGVNFEGGCEVRTRQCMFTQPGQSPRAQEIFGGAGERLYSAAPIGIHEGVVVTGISECLCRGRSEQFGVMLFDQQKLPFYVFVVKRSESCFVRLRRGEFSP